MVTASATLSRPPIVRRLLLHHPELCACAVVAAAWATLVVVSSRGPTGRAAPPSMAGMDMPGTGATRDTWSVVASGLPSWALMTVAMMGPAALAGIRHVGLNSLRWRRGRAMAEFAAAYLAVWTSFGLFALAVAALVPGVPGAMALGVVLAAAAGWQLTPLKRRWLRDCHRSVPLPPHGWKAEQAALRFGLRNGATCLGSGWCLMLVMAVAPGGHIVWTVALAGVVTTERLLERPRRVTRLASAALGIAAVGAVAAALV
jgi:predicted metal-binding membrane protein